MIECPGVNYTKLRDYLSSKKSQEADRETWAAICQSLSLTATP
ncbi:MAG: hypothetical protein U7126_30420 [Microcoleus sp.]